MISSEAQEAFRQAARGLLMHEAHEARLRGTLASPAWRVQQLHEQLAQLDWFGLLVPVSQGGAGGSVSDALVILEEAGHADAPTALLSSGVLAVCALRLAGDQAQQEHHLPAIASGATIATLAVTEAGGSLSPAEFTTTLTPRSDGYVLTGTKRFVPDAQRAQLIVVAARRPGTTGADGISLVVTRQGDPGLAVSPLPTVSGQRSCEVVLDHVPVAATQVLGPSGGAWPVIEELITLGAVGSAAGMVGGAQRALDLALEHATGRTQFGRPIASFQPVQAFCVDMLGLVASARAITARAAAAIDAEAAARHRLGSTAKAWTSDAFTRVTELAHRVHGAIGFSQEHPLQATTRAALAQRAAFGDPAFHKDRIAAEL